MPFSGQFPKLAALPGKCAKSPVNRPLSAASTSRSLSTRPRSLQGGHDRTQTPSDRTSGAAGSCRRERTCGRRAGGDGGDQPRRRQEALRGTRAGRAGADRTLGGPLAGWGSRHGSRKPAGRPPPAKAPALPGLLCVALHCQGSESSPRVKISHRPYGARFTIACIPVACATGQALWPLRGPAAASRAAPQKDTDCRGIRHWLGESVFRPSAGSGPRAKSRGSPQSAIRIPQSGRGRSPRGGVSAPCSTACRRGHPRGPGAHRPSWPGTSGSRPSPGR